MTKSDVSVVVVAMVVVVVASVVVGAVVVGVVVVAIVVLVAAPSEVDAGLESASSPLHAATNNTKAAATTV